MTLSLKQNIRILLSGQEKQANNNQHSQKKKELFMLEKCQFTGYCKLCQFSERETYVIRFVGLYSDKISILALIVR